MAESLSVIIVTYNSAEVLPGLLDSLPAALAGVEHTRVLVIDNDSRDVSCAIARNHPVGVEVIQMGRNAGYAAAINAGYSAVGIHDDVMVLNPDLRLAPGAAATLLHASKSPGIGIVAPKLLEADGRLAPSIRKEPSLTRAWSEALLGGSLAGRLRVGEVVTRSAIYRDGGCVDWATGAALLVTAQARRAIGPWDERFFLYSEETDYMRRARAAGFAVRYEPRASATHRGGDGGVAPALHALLTGNRIRYFRTYHGAVPSLLFRAAVATGEAIRCPKGGIYPAGLRAALARI